MADVTGPISTLPGSGHGFPDGAMCDEHPDRPAVRRVQGETDSFGSEMHDMCAECHGKYRAEMSAPDPGKCDWCKADVNDRSHKRDYEEGMSGRVYLVCKPCADRYDESVMREAVAHDADYFA